MALFIFIGLIVCIGLTKSHDNYGPPGSYNGGPPGGYGGRPPPGPGGFQPPPPPPYGGDPPGGRGRSGGCSRGNCAGCNGNCGVDQSGQVLPGTQPNQVMPGTQPNQMPGTQPNPVIPGTQPNQVMPGNLSQISPLNPITQSQVLPTRLPNAGVTAPSVQLPILNQTLLPPGGLPMPPVALPDGSIILPNGHVRFPNGTTLLSRYTPGAARPVARLPSGVLMFPDNTTRAAGSVTTFPAPGFPLNATSEATSYPPVLLPKSTIVHRNGSIVTPGLKMLPTTFIRSPSVAQ